ncbi:hypothetical protein SLEP1_g44416 [Rubroshorea leprosula]|uniref:Uncharacterized protein n=1 Tax=Rubroshorea leprosula TaxID=152421 RepID=A0AAV5LHZ9_9ROSI|nr:hypothetical protein SLEP1_g44416 [Rubroshorea leprosula]
MSTRKEKLAATWWKTKKDARGKLSLEPPDKYLAPGFSPLIQATGRHTGELRNWRESRGKKETERGEKGEGQL